MRRTNEGHDGCRTRTIFVALTLLFVPNIVGCDIVFRVLNTNGFWTSVNNVGRVIGSGSSDPFAWPTPQGPVIDSLAEDARFVASRLASCPLEETRIVRRRRRRFTAVGCGRVIVVRCHVPPDGSPTRCREVHPRAVPAVADAAATASSASVPE